MKILFVYPNLNLPSRMNHGLAALSAFMKKQGHLISLIQLNTRASFKELNYIRRIKPDMISFSTCTNQWGVTRFLAEEIKRKYAIKIFVGGTHPTVYPECLLETKAIDGICRGEGEFPLLDLAKRISTGEALDSLPNFWIRKGDVIFKNNITPLIENLDELPLPDWDIFDEETILAYPAFSFSRGCLYSCNYCINSSLRELYKGRGTYTRMKSVDRAIAEIKDKISKYDLKILNFDDDVFLKDRQWISGFCQKYRQGISLPFNFNARPENITEDICLMLKEAGAKMVGIGIESGDPEIRKEVLGRTLNDETIMRAFKIARQAGLETYSFNMIGIPGETGEKFKKTISLNKDILPTGLQLSIFYPYPGTPLGELCLKSGYIKHGSTDGYFGRSILELPGFPRKQIHQWYDKFEYLVYKDTNFKKALKFRLSKFVHRYGWLNFISVPLRRLFQKSR